MTIALFALAAAAADDVSPFSGVAAADEYQRRLAAFQTDASISLAKYTSGHLASFDPSGDGGGLGDVLGLVAREAAAALAHGCRYTSPHTVAPWRYATVASRAGLCAVADGWRCVFADAYAPLPADHPDRLHNQADEKFPVGEAVCGDRAGLAAHGLALGAAPDDGVCGGGAGASEALIGAALRAAAAARPPVRGRVRLTELPDGAVEAAAALVDPARCDDGEWRVAQLIRFAWTPAPHVASYVAEKAAAAGVPPRDESGAPLPYVALHVRRGDACRCFGGCCWGNADGGGRHCFALEEYIELGATLATALNARHLLLATEDADEAARAPALAAAHGLTLVVQPWPRAAFSDATGLGDCDGDGVGGSRADVFTRIEAAMDTGAVDAEGMILSAVADMSWIADADGLVGGISLFSKVARLLALGRKGREIPFIDIAGGRARAWRAERYDAQRAGGAPTQTCTTDAHGGQVCTDAADAAGAGGGACPTAAEYMHALDANRDGKLSRCEADALFRPLTKVPRRAELPPGCARLYDCMANRTDELADAVPWPAPPPEAAGAAALCRHPDNGPFPCLEEGCPDDAAAVPCQFLARGETCGAAADELWEAPPAWFKGWRVWQLCPHACGKCPRPQRRRRRGKPIHDPISGEIVGFEAPPRDDNPGSCDG